MKEKAAAILKKKLSITVQKHQEDLAARDLKNAKYIKALEEQHAKRLANAAARLKVSKEIA